MAGDQNIEVVRLHRFDDDDSKLKAFVDIAIGDFIVKGFRIVQGKKGLFLGMPREQGKDGKWYDAFCTKTEEAKQSLIEVALTAYQE
ncbi:MAG TPA: septation protein SpoVG family protein [Candidatus Omnitrophota bacterium]|nr:septation protein SpoVG family protein [Candidatus Omnitrophota bacterium]